jgi:GDP-L-fucose synthase
MKKIWLTGSGGMVGSAVLEELLRINNESYEVHATASSDLDLRDQKSTYKYVDSLKPDIAILSAARVGGVHSNSAYPAVFALENQLMQTNALQALVNNGVKKVIFVGSSCIYPSKAPIPLSPESLNSGDFEGTNKWYAMAKLSMIFSLDAVAKQYGVEVVTLLPTNLYGPKDNFHELDGHVIPSLMIKAIRAREQGTPLNVWGSGKPMREVLFVDDFAKAVVATLKASNLPPVINVGSGDEFSILEIASKVKQAVGLDDDIVLDETKPDGAFRKPLNSSAIRSIGWSPKISFDDGLARTYKWMVENKSNLRQKGVQIS